MLSIAKLKELVQESTDLSDVLDYFFHLSESGKLVSVSEIFNEQDIKQNNTIQMLIQVVEYIAGNFLKRKLKINQPMLCLIDKEFFYHGVLIAKDAPIPLYVFYFSDLNKGILSLMGADNQTEMFRFSLAIMDKMPVMTGESVRH